MPKLTQPTCHRVSVSLKQRHVLILTKALDCCKLTEQFRTVPFHTALLSFQMKPRKKKKAYIQNITAYTELFLTHICQN